MPDEPSRPAAPLITIIVRSDGRRPRLFREAVQSVLDQIYEPLELVVVEDGGERLAPALDALHKPETVAVRYRSITHGGRSRAGNAGLAMAQGAYIGFLDDDDALLPDHVATLAAALDRDTSAAAAFAPAFEVRRRGLAPGSGGGRDIGRRPAGRTTFLRPLLMTANFLPIQTVLFRRALYETLGGFDESLDYLEDWDLWLRYSLAHKFVGVDKVTSLYRVPAEKSVLRAREAAHAPAREKILAKHAATAAPVTVAEMEAMRRDFLDRRDEFASARWALGRILRRLGRRGRR